MPNIGLMGLFLGSEWKTFVQMVAYFQILFNISPRKQLKAESYFQQTLL